MNKDEERAVKRKVRILEHAEHSGNVAKTCRYFGIPRSTFYVWRAAFMKGGEHALLPKKTVPKH